MQFVFVYTQENHPDQAMHVPPGSPVDATPVLSLTTNRAEREQRARKFRRTMKGGARRILVDEDGDEEGMFTKAQCLYHMKSLGGRIFVIDHNRRIKAVSGIDRLEKQLLELYPDLASDLKRKDADSHPSHLSADG